MKITDIAPQVHNKQRKSIFVDNKYAFSLDETDAVKLKIGMEITAQQLEQLNVESNYSKALAKALDYLSRTPHTQKDIENKLGQKGYDCTVIRMVCEELCSMGLIDDREYANLYMEYASEKFYGPAKIRYELSNHGVSAEIISELLQSFECDCAAELAHLVLQKYRGCDFSDRKVKARVTRFLASRGYDFDVINRAIAFCSEQNMWDEEE